MKHLVNQIQEETKLKASIIEQMTALAKELPEYNELLSIPGLGVRTVVSLIGELGDIRRFRNSNALNAFIGSIYGTMSLVIMSLIIILVSGEIR